MNAPVSDSVARQDVTQSCCHCGGDRDLEHVTNNERQDTNRERVLNVPVHPLRELRNSEAVDNCCPQYERSCDATSRRLRAQVRESADCERGCNEAKKVAACRSKKCSEASFASGEDRKSDPAQQYVDYLAKSSEP
jgi:hypothetical protein